MLTHHQQRQETHATGSGRDPDNGRAICATAAANQQRHCSEAYDAGDLHSELPVSACMDWFRA
jgi:hypothetical protein